MSCTKIMRGGAGEPNPPAVHQSNEHNHDLAVALNQEQQGMPLPTNGGGSGGGAPAQNTGSGSNNSFSNLENNVPRTANHKVTSEFNDKVNKQAAIDGVSKKTLIDFRKFILERFLIKCKERGIQIEGDKDQLKINRSNIVSMAFGGNEAEFLFITISQNAASIIFSSSIW